MSAPMGTPAGSAPMATLSPATALDGPTSGQGGRGHAEGLAEPRVPGAGGEVEQLRP